MLAPWDWGRYWFKNNHMDVVVSYAYRSLSDLDRRYSQTEKEALGLVWACEKFHPYIYGKCFELLTDHKPLEAVYGPNHVPGSSVGCYVSSRMNSR